MPSPMRETSSPPSEMCFMTVWLLVVVKMRRVQESTGSRKVRVPVDRGTGRVSQARPGGSTLRLWTPRSEIREFLTSRRARITPDQVGVASYGPSPRSRAAPRGGRRPSRRERSVLHPARARRHERRLRERAGGTGRRAPTRRRRTRPPASTSPVPHTRRPRGLVGAEPSSASGPRSSGPSTRSPAPPRS